MKCLLRFKWFTLSFLLLTVSISQAKDGPQSSAKTYSLSLKETTQLALKNNFDIQLAKYDAWIMQTEKNKAVSLYDTLLSAEVKYQDNQRKQTTTIFGTKAVDNNYSVGASKKLPSGTTINIDMNNSRSVTNSIFSTSSVTHDSTLGVTVTQDLGKNFFGLKDRGQIKVTLLDIENTEYTSLDKIEKIIAEIQKSYWDLLLENEQVKITQDMVMQAKHLYDLHQEKLKDGLLEKPEAIASEANYKKRQDELTLVQNKLAEKNNALKLLLNITNNDLVIKPSENFKIIEKKEILTKSLKKAFINRRDYKKTKNTIKAKKITLRLKKNNTWPEINLTATLERNGLGDHFKQAVTQITEEDNPNLMAGLKITFPLENKKAKAELKAAELSKAKEILAIKLLERQITIQIMDQVRNCNTYLSLAKSSQEIADLQTQKLEEEEKRFNQGRSDTDTLIRFQEDLARARSDAASSKHRYHTALVDLKQKSGVLLKRDKGL
ncbi:hypothetical protein MNBD_UNCLBAC01-882 [hydrothermal vent metagenome]|uniref:Outer membrane efflux protein n=1 Tax=hydrothermal vent metagenome TaxID=652676 RepID=A0A3B1DMM5_9ZZZZ